MKFTIGLFSLLAAVAIAAPSSIDGMPPTTFQPRCHSDIGTARTDTVASMSDGQGGATAYRNTGKPVG